MNPRVLDLARHRMAQAEESKKDAELLLKHSSYRSASNRVYYAVFYAARGLLAMKGLDSSKHSGVISLFNKEYVKPGLMSHKSSAILKEAFSLRMKGDYEDYAEVSKEKVKHLLKECALFLSEAKKVLQEMMRE